MCCWSVSMRAVWQGGGLALPVLHEGGGGCINQAVGGSVLQLPMVLSEACPAPRTLRPHVLQQELWPASMCRHGKRGPHSFSKEPSVLCLYSLGHYGRVLPLSNNLHSSHSGAQNKQSTPAHKKHCFCAWLVLCAGVVDVCLIPEVPFQLHGEKGLLNYLEHLVQRKGHCVVCVAEGAGQVNLAGVAWHPGARIEATIMSIS